MLGASFAMGDNKGTDNLFEGSSCWFLTEAECTDMDSLEELFENSTEDESILSQLIDDEPVEQGNSLALYNEQLTDACNAAVTALKRKLIGSPEQVVTAELSPKLAAIEISPKRKSKRRLFDSGIEDETANNNEKVELDTLEKENSNKDIEEGIANNTDIVTAEGLGTVNTDEQELNTACYLVLNANNSRACMLAKFKERYGVSFMDLTRAFKSDKTCSTHWLINVHCAAETAIEGSKEVLKQFCDFYQITSYGMSALYLLQFQAMKNRLTVCNLICKMLNVSDKLLMCEPPRTRSTPVAMYFVKQTMSNACTTYGVTPDWIASLTMINHQAAATAEAFDFSTMVQWAYDNDITTEPAVAYGYAELAHTDKNAAAFLKCNSQVRYVKDCVSMVKYYKRYEMSQMTMAGWIVKCCEECKEEGNWKVIAEFLRYQEVPLIRMLNAMRLFFQGIPKKNCLVIHGDPDTGKSYFCSSLITFLKGRVISFMNRHSNFWLQPLLDAKIGYLDDATYAAWLFMDVNMRNALDGNYISLDAKHKAPIQLKLPPLLITSNIDVMKDQSLKYLHSRLLTFEFKNKLPFDEDNNLIYKITDGVWSSFFKRLAGQLGLKEEFEDGTGRADKAFRCSSGSDINIV